MSARPSARAAAVSLTVPAARPLHEDREGTLAVVEELSDLSLWAAFYRFPEPERRTAVEDDEVADLQTEVVARLERGGDEWFRRMRAYQAGRDDERRAASGERLSMAREDES